jgi:hypothetical protein
MIAKASRGLALTLIVLSMVSCTTVKGWFGKGGAGDAKPVAAQAPVEKSQDYEADLRKLVSRDIESAAQNEAADRERLVKKSPYYFKEYAVYPDGPDKIDVVIQETESRTRPYVADVKLDKTRYATVLHRSREDARADENFLRETGKENITFEYRNGAWVRVGSLFVAEKTEENVNGEWVPQREDIKRTVAAEEKKGWFGRMWSKVTGSK